MSRAERWATMGLDAWDEWTPGEVRAINRHRPAGNKFKPSVVPGVIIQTSEIPQALRDYAASPERERQRALTRPRPFTP
jgi:hypothetical protein